MNKPLKDAVAELQKEHSEKYKIAYVDEQGRGIRDFQRKFSDDFEVEGFLPTKEIDDLIEKIFKAGVKAVVTDFLLTEYKTDIKFHVPYDGVNLVQAIREKRHGFPCFVLTSFDGDAIQESNDVNMIYPKDALNKKLGNTTLQKKVQVQIKHYIANIEKNSKEFNILVEKRHAGELTAKEEARLLELDTLLENSLNGKKALTKAEKQSSGIEKLNELISSTDALIKELRKGKAK